MRGFTLESVRSGWKAAEGCQRWWLGEVNYWLNIWPPIPLFFSIFTSYLSPGNEGLWAFSPCALKRARRGALQLQYERIAAVWTTAVLPAAPAAGIPCPGSLFGPKKSFTRYILVEYTAACVYIPYPRAVHPDAAIVRRTPALLATHPCPFHSHTHISI